MADPQRLRPRRAKPTVNWLNIVFSLNHQSTVPGTAAAKGQRSVYQDQSRKKITPRRRVPSPRTTTGHGVVAKINTQPISAIMLGSGYSHILYGRGISGARFLSNMSAKI